MVIFSVIIALVLVRTVVFNGKRREYNDDAKISRENDFEITDTVDDLKTPNIILILTDDLGYGDISSFGSTMIEI